MTVTMATKENLFALHLKINTGHIIKIEVVSCEASGPKPLLSLSFNFYLYHVADNSDFYSCKTVKLFE